MATPIPVSIIGGYLGAGKTTLVNHLLRHRDERRLAVLVNDFGELPIDAALIESRDGNLLQLAGGCICCSFGSDLMAALQQVRTLQPRPQQILVETSGVARPDAVARTLCLLPDLRLDAVLVLADAEAVRGRAADRYVGELVQQQLAGADLILLNKCDLVPPEQLDALQRWLSATVATARIVCCTHAQIDPALWLGGSDAPPVSRRVATTRPGGAALALPTALATDLFESLSLEFEHAVHAPQLAEALASPPLQLLRAKGLMRDADGRPLALHLVGRRASCEPAPPGSVVSSGRLVCIAVSGQLQAGRIRAALAACAA